MFAEGLAIEVIPFFAVFHFPPQPHHFIHLWTFSEGSLFEVILLYAAFPLLPIHTVLSSQLQGPMERTMLEQISTGQPMEDVTEQQVDVP